MGGDGGREVGRQGSYEMSRVGSHFSDPLNSMKRLLKRLLIKVNEVMHEQFHPILRGIQGQTFNATDT